MVVFVYGHTKYDLDMIYLDRSPVLMKVYEYATSGKFSDMIDEEGNIILDFGDIEVDKDIVGMYFRYVQGEMLPITDDLSMVIDYMGGTRYRDIDDVLRIYPTMSSIVSMDDTDAIDLLMSTNGQCTIPDGDVGSAMEYAITDGHVGIVRQVIEYISTRSTDPSLCHNEYTISDEDLVVDAMENDRIHLLEEIYRYMSNSTLLMPVHEVQHAIIHGVHTESLKAMIRGDSRMANAILDEIHIDNIDKFDYGTLYELIQYIHSLGIPIRANDVMSGVLHMNVRGVDVLSILQLLVTMGGNWNGIVHLAAIGWFDEVLEYIKPYIDPSEYTAANKYGNTPLHWALLGPGGDIGYERRDALEPTLLVLKSMGAVPSGDTYGCNDSQTAYDRYADYDDIDEDIYQWLKSFY